MRIRLCTLIGGLEMVRDHRYRNVRVRDGKRPPIQECKGKRWEETMDTGM